MKTLNYLTSRCDIKIEKVCNYIIRLPSSAPQAAILIFVWLYKFFIMKLEGLSFPVLVY